MVMQCLPPWDEICWMTILRQHPAGSDRRSRRGQGWLGQLAQGLEVIPLAFKGIDANLAEPLNVSLPLEEMEVLESYPSWHGPWHGPWHVGKH